MVDGGYLLHVVHWNEGSSYAQVAQQYVSYVLRHYGSSSVVVFDGYGTSSIKDQEHQRRAHKFAPDIILDAANMAHKDQGAFLANDHNKGAFVEFLISALRLSGLAVHQASDDADTLVVAVALGFASSNQSVSVVANDTDVLVLLVYHFRSSMSEVFMLSQPGKPVHSIRAITSALGSTIVSRLLVIHALSGCDTTSCLFGHGKVSVYKKLSKGNEIQPYINTLESTTATHTEILIAGCGLTALLYGGNFKDSLNHLRYASYMHVSATSSQLPRPERLPPTENAAKFHVYRTHLQVLQWKMLSTTDINPEDWGWKIHEGKFIPIANDMEVAPEDILKVACCKCSAAAKKPCGSRACLCRKYGLSCVAACKNCNGVSCDNANECPIVSGVEDDDLDGDGLAAEEADVFDGRIMDDIVDDDFLEFHMPWILEEEVLTSDF